MKTRVDPCSEKSGSQHSFEAASMPEYIAGEATKITPAIHAYKSKFRVVDTPDCREQLQQSARSD
jgi:hypothetical protein